jgi:hypothetical protein
MLFEFLLMTFKSSAELFPDNVDVLHPVLESHHSSMSAPVGERSSASMLVLARDTTENLSVGHAAWITPIML